jgi:hypothetical protein
MDHILQAPYNPHSFNPVIMQNASTASLYPPSGSTSSDRITASMSSSIMPSQLTPQSGFVANNARTSAVLPSAPSNEPKTFWTQSSVQVASLRDGSAAQACPGSEQGPSLVPVSSAPPQDRKEPGGPTATAPFLRDFNLVAEAAKRAQMSIVMRDLESISL